MSYSCTFYPSLVPLLYLQPSTNNPLSLQTLYSLLPHRHPKYNPQHLHLHHSKLLLAYLCHSRPLPLPHLPPHLHNPRHPPTPPHPHDALPKCHPAPYRLGIHLPPPRRRAPTTTTPPPAPRQRIRQARLAIRPRRAYVLDRPTRRLEG